MATPTPTPTPTPEPPFDELVRYVLLTMGVIVFVIAILSILRGAYLAGLLTCVAIFAIALAGLLPHVEEIRLPFGIRIRVRRRRK